MASYFVARHPLPDGAHAVHNRSRCPPACFPERGTEYLGEFSDAAQAVAVARLRYAGARGCAGGELPMPLAAAAARMAAQPLTPLRS
jgi:hypothetical protein